MGMKPRRGMKGMERDRSESPWIQTYPDPHGSRSVSLFYIFLDPDLDPFDPNLTLDPTRSRTLIILKASWMASEADR